MILVQDKERWSQSATSRPLRPAVPSVQRFRVGGQNRSNGTNRWSDGERMPILQGLSGGQ
ncbi:hypothetical protein C4565_04545 [Candidatus Parcubacteria bacterium]|nr:MAG: hypothetical protein C4565_04545 [Candidatus Parcubacteria bacterium]